MTFPPVTTFFKIMSGILYATVFWMLFSLMVADGAFAQQRVLKTDPLTIEPEIHQPDIEDQKAPLTLEPQRMNKRDLEAENDSDRITLPEFREGFKRAQRFQPMPVAVLQTLDKVTGRTETREVAIGETIRFGPLYGIVRTCRESPPIEEPESAIFLQVWEPVLSADQPDVMKAETRWVFSGWMFASSPALSAMDHPIYDIWVLDCKDGNKNSTDDDDLKRSPR